MSTWAVKSAKSIDSSCRKGKGFNSVLALLPSPRKLGKSNQKGEESPYDRVRGLSSPRAWEVALVPFPENFAPLPTQAQTGLACQAGWEFPPSLKVLESRPVRFRVVAIAEVGDTVTADHLTQMATLPDEHMLFFCTSRGAVCAGCAQVTLSW